MSTRIVSPAPEFLDFSARARTHASLGVSATYNVCLGMSRTDPEVNSYGTAKQGLVRWMDRRSRGDCADSDTPNPKAKLIGELLHTFLMTVRSVRLAIGRGADMTSAVFSSMLMRATRMPRKRSSSCSPT